MFSNISLKRFQNIHRPEDAIPRTPIQCWSANFSFSQKETPSRADIGPANDAVSMGGACNIVWGSGATSSASAEVAIKFYLKNTCIQPERLSHRSCWHDHHFYWKLWKNYINYVPAGVKTAMAQKTTYANIVWGPGKNSSWFRCHPLHTVHFSCRDTRNIIIKKYF